MKVSTFQSGSHEKLWQFYLVRMFCWRVSDQLIHQLLLIMLVHWWHFDRHQNCVFQQWIPVAVHECLGWHTANNKWRQSHHHPHYIGIGLLSDWQLLWMASYSLTASGASRHCKLLSSDCLFYWLASVSLFLLSTLLRLLNHEHFWASLCATDWRWSETVSLLKFVPASVAIAGSMPLWQWSLTMSANFAVHVVTTIPM